MFKKLLAMALSTTILMSMGTVAFATETTSKEDIEIFVNNVPNVVLQAKKSQTFNPNVSYKYTPQTEITEKDILSLHDGYDELMAYANSNNIPLNMDLETFVSEYKARPYTSVDEYLNVYYLLLVPMRENQPSTRSSSSGGSDYYYDIGTSLPTDVTPDYSEYNLLSTVQKGDLIYEANGGFGITGHIAIVEGFYHNEARDITYIRIIEAISDGVCRSLLDDTRVDEKAVTVLRVSGVDDTTKNSAISFCVGELGSSYSLDFQKDTSSSETNWYCSELVWAGYYNQGIDIEREPFLSEPGVTPRDIFNSEQVYSINFQ